MRIVLSLLVGSTLLGVANWFGWWQVTFVVGALCGLLATRSRQGVWMSLVTGALGWGAPLVVLSFSSKVEAMAGVFGRIVGIGDGSVSLLMLLVPSLFGAMLSLMAAWLVTAIKGVVKPTVR